MDNGKNYRNAILEQIESVKALLGTDHDLLREMQAKHDLLQALYAELDENGLGMIVVTGSGDSWALVLPDASHPGQFRYSGFRDLGWTCHQTYNTIDEVIYRAFEAGYRHLAPRETLDQMALTPTWQKGCERLPLIDKMNAGAITYAEMLAQFELIERRYAERKAA